MAAVSKVDVAEAIGRMYQGEAVAEGLRLLRKSAAKAVNLEGDLAMDGCLGFKSETPREAAEWVASRLVETGDPLLWEDGPAPAPAVPAPAFDGRCEYCSEKESVNDPLADFVVPGSTVGQTMLVHGECGYGAGMVMA